MSTYAGERELERDGGVWGRGMEWLLSRDIAVSREALLYTALIVAAVALRFTDLGYRALHHDESLHATYSYYLATGKGYTHDPLMHGPFLFHISALMFLLFGASDASSRFAPAFFGAALVMLPLLLRPWLGKVGAFATAAFIAFSPALLYYSRFDRNESWIAFWTLGLIACIFQYQRTRRDRYLYASVAFLMLEFCSKETAYIFAAIVVSYLVAATAGDFVGPLLAPAKRLLGFGPDRWAEPGGFDLALRAGLFLLLLVAAVPLVVLWPALKSLRERLDLDGELPAHGVLLMVLGLCSVPQFSAAVRIPLKALFAFDVNGIGTYSVFGHQLTHMQLAGGVTVIGLLLATMLVGLWWNDRKWLICAAIFYVPYFLLYTTFLTNKAGWGSGIWGSLNYWLDQQDVRRGVQPVWYYATTVPAYEYLTLALATIGIAWRAVRRGVVTAVLLVAALALIALLPLVHAHAGNSGSRDVAALALLLLTGSMAGDRLRQFLVFYSGALFFALSVAGEKMPWLTVHLALPLTVLAGLAVADLFRIALKLRNRAQDAFWAAVGLSGGLAAVLAMVLASRSTGAVTRLAAFAAALVGVAAGLWLLHRFTDLATLGWGQRTAALATAVLIGVAGLWTLRADWRMNFIHSDTPDELLIYTQTSPDLPVVARKIDRFAQESGQGHNLAITIDGTDSFTWPWAWYLRDYPNTAYIDLDQYVTNPTLAASLHPGQVLVAGQANVQIVSQFPGMYGAGERLHHRWWFPEEGYRSITAHGIAQDIKNFALFRRWFTYITNRDGFAVPLSDINTQNDGSAQAAARQLATGHDAAGHPYLGSVDSTVFFPASYVPGKGLNAQTATAPVATAHLTGQTLSLGGRGVLGGQLHRPAGVAEDSAGNLYIADSLNNRIQKFDAKGTLLAQSDGPSTGVRLTEPWGVAVDSAGMVYVADTWAHRIVKLDANLHLVTAWGRPAPTGGAQTLLDLYGPRDIVVEPDGNLLVTDTGNQRVIRFDPSGNPLGAFGSKGSGPGQFDEPVGIAESADGTIFVADTWNNRVQIFNHDGSYRGEFATSWVSDTAGKGLENKPYLAVLADGTIVLTYPEGDGLVRYDQRGTVLLSVNTLPGLKQGLVEPLGVAVGANGDLLLSDGTLDQLIRLPVTALR